MQGFILQMSATGVELSIVLDDKPTREQYDKAVLYISRLIWEKLEYQKKV